MMKKLTALLLALIFWLSLSISVNAQEKSLPDNNEKISNNNSEQNDFPLTEESESEEAADNECEEENDVTDNEFSEEINVVRMWICSSFLGYFPTGHTWLYFENLTQEPVLIGIYELQPGSGVSVGTYGNQFKGFGLYYNIETFKGTPSDIHSLSTELTVTELETVCNEILNHNYWELFILNCVYSATRIWNAVSETKTVYTFLPIFLMLDIRIKKGEIDTPLMIQTTKDDIYKLKKTNGEFYLVCCNEMLII